MDQPAATDLPRAAPEAVGVASRTIARFLDNAALAGLELHSFMVFHHGHVIAEGWWAPYRSDRPHMQHSLAKSFTATAVGLAVAEGRIALDDQVAGLFPDAVPKEAGPYLGAMTVRHLLTMTTGHREGISGGAWRQIGSSWVAEFFKAPLIGPPGVHFVYSSASSYMLSAILQRATGETLHDYLRARLFRPLGITGTTWDLCPNGINPGGNGLACRTEDLLKLAVLHLQQGEWNGHVILPRGWVREATCTQVAAPREPDTMVLGPADMARPRGYGFQWWTGPTGAFYASGLFGQYAIALPAQDAAIAFTAALHPQDGRLLDLIWRDLVPALGAGPGLAARLSGLRLALPNPGPDSPTAARVSGRWFRFDPNVDGIWAVMLRFDGAICVFTLCDDRGRHTVTAGLTGWVAGATTMTGNVLHHQYQPEQMQVAASSGWPDPHTFIMTWQFTETAFRDTVVCRFDGDRLALTRSVNVNTGPITRPVLSGVAMGDTIGGFP